MIPCDKCGKPTVEKEITAGANAKNPGSKYSLRECTSGCKHPNGKWNYTFFPPKEVKANSQPSLEQKLDRILKLVELLAQEKHGYIPD